MEKIIIIRYCEIFLKGDNRRFFEKLLQDNVRKSLSGLNCKVVDIRNRLIVKGFTKENERLVFDALKKVFGIHSMSEAYEIDTSKDGIIELAVELCKNKKGTFRVTANRADKTFPMNSMALAGEVGYFILNDNSSVSVDLTDPSFTVNIDIRENGKTYVFTDVIKGLGGMPSGSAGKGLILISGGIDSPVAGYMMAKRGMKMNALHFHSYPYTSPAAKEKVVKLTEMVSAYSAGIVLNVVSFTKIQEAIHEHCAEEFMIAMMRRFMMRIAERLALKQNCKAIITGESLGQVASQTIESINSSNSVVEKLPVFRPLIGMDKNEIIEISRKIGTFETSILPYEDCCTVFLPKHPVIRPKMEEILKQESRLDVEGLIAEALETIEKIEV